MEEWVLWGVTTVVTVGVPIVAGFIRRLFGMIDSKANKESTDKRFDQMMSELKEQRQDLKDHSVEDRQMHSEVLKELRTVNSNLATTNAKLSNLDGRIGSEGR